MKQRKIIVAIAMSVMSLCGTTSLYAVPAKPGLISYTQTDGTRIRIRITGDEFSNQVISEEGFTLVSSDRDYYFASVARSGELISSGIKARPLSDLSAEEYAIVNNIPRGVQASFTPSPLRMKEPNVMRTGVTKDEDGKLKAPKGVRSFSPTTGSMNSLVILAQFSDVKFTVENPQQAFEDMLNTEGYSKNGATGSARDYYVTASMGQFDPHFEVMEPVTLPNTAAFYGGVGGTDNAIQMALDACRLADETVDFSRYADDGQIRDVFIFFAGHNRAEGAPGTIWPHRYANPDQPMATFDGCLFTAYACSSELRGAEGSNMSGIGTFSHEFGHVLGWVDLYDTDGGNNGESMGMDYFSIMCYGTYLNNGRTPPPPMMLERWMAGWAEPRILTEAGNYTVKPIAEADGVLIEADEHNEYFMLDYRDTNSSPWEKYLSHKGDLKGFVITHIDFTEPKQIDWEWNMVNTYSRYELVDLIRSDYGNPDYPEKTVYPGASNVTSLTAKTNKDYMTWSKKNMDFEIFNISANEKDGSFLLRSYADQGKARVELTSILNGRYNLKTISVSEGATVTWYVNGEESADGKATLSTIGMHVIEAAIQLPSGETQHIVKYYEKK